MFLEERIVIVPAGTTAACHHAQRILAEQGFTVVDHPTPEATHLLLDVPSFEAPGRLRGGGEISRWLDMLPPKTTVIGGNLDCTELAGYPVLDLMQDCQYVAQNAAITAYCALEVAAPLVETTLADGPSLIVGWGRIGKCLARLLRGLGAEVTVAARKESDRAMLRALGYRSLDTARLGPRLNEFAIVWNTVPQQLVSREEIPPSPRFRLIELASRPGINWENAVSARGLPGKYAPASSGNLIAQSIIRILGRD